MSNIKALRQRKAELVAAQRKMLGTLAAEDDREFTEAEASTYKANTDKLESLERKLETEEKLLEYERSAGIPVDETPGAQAAGTTAGKGGDDLKFKSIGEELLAVVNYTRSNGRKVDQRLFAAASGASEAVPSDGGFLVQKDFSSEILKRVYETGQISSRVRRIPISSVANGLKINAVDETSRADGSRWGGVQSYWANEADALTGTKPKFRQIELNLSKLTALYYATDEVLQDAEALGAIFTEAFSEEMSFKVEESIFNGSGAGQPLGFMNSPALITVAKDSGDSTATVSTNDILNMWERLPARSRANAVWFINQDVEKSLYPLTLGSGSLGQILLFTPPNTNNPQGMLMGRPVIPTEHNATLGTPGDIVLVDLAQYIMIDKGAPRQDSSMHVRFLNDEMVFRTTYRVDGQGWWNKALTPKNGTNTQSPFVALATRP